MVARTRKGPELDSSIIAAVLVRLGQQSERAIARALRIGRASVQRIRLGLHTAQQHGPRYERCACGALTEEQPCLACQIRQHVPDHAPPT
jgi:hypothetical protein